jgi:hypothetical protein
MVHRTVQLQLQNQQLYSPLWKGPSPNWFDPEMITHGGYLIESYNKLSGKELVNMELYSKDPEKAIKEMFMNCNRIVLSHGTQKDNDGPILNYGNTAALKLFAADWDSLTKMPSRYTASTEVDRDLRQKFMQTVTDKGYVDNYTGVRIGLNKVKFAIKEAEVWNIVIQGTYIGQAASFEKYEFL